MIDLAENITKVVLGVLKRGGDDYNIYVAVKAALVATPAVGGEALTKALNEFSNFINEPPQYEDRRMVRDYRHELARKWIPVFEAIQTSMATPAAPPASPSRGMEIDALRKIVFQQSSFELKDNELLIFEGTTLTQLWRLLLDAALSVSPPEHPAAVPFQPHENCNCLMCLAERAR